MKQNKMRRNTTKVLHRVSLVFVIAILTTSCFLFNPDSASEAQDFPNKVGNSWTYQFKDDISGTTGNLEVEIVGEDDLPGGQIAKLWQLTYPKSIDTLWVVSDDTSAVGYLHARYGRFEEEFTFIFPLDVENTWSPKVAVNDSVYKVLDKTTVTIPGDGSYHSVYKVSRTIPPIANYAVFDTLWFKERVGIIKYFKKRYNLGPASNATWELVSYNLK